MIRSRNIKSMSVYLCHDDGNVVLVKSPERIMKIGIKMKIGWAIAIIGFYIMFGHNKEWRTILNPQDGE